jgi:hypothetical protein
MPIPPRNPDRVGWLQLMCRRSVAYAKEPLTTREIAVRSLTRVAVLERHHMQSVWRACQRFLKPVGWRNGQRLWVEKYPGEFLSRTARLTGKSLRDKD